MPICQTAESLRAGIEIDCISPAKPLEFALIFRTDSYTVFDKKYWFYRYEKNIST
jgi:hypothetical protein